MQNIWQEILSCYLYLLWLNNHFGKEKTLNYTDCTWNPCKLEYEVLMYPKQNARFSGCGIFLGIIRLTITNFVTTKNPYTNARNPWTPVQNSQNG